MARRRAWADFIVNLDIADAVIESVNLLTQTPDIDTITVARLIGRLRLVHTSLTAQIDSRMVLDIGIGVASSEAFIVGSGLGLPQPGGAGSAPPRGWLYRTQIECLKVHSTGTQYEILLPGDISFDVGAMRKVDKGILFMAVESKDVAGTVANVQLTGLIRALCLT